MYGINIREEIEYILKSQFCKDIKVNEYIEYSLFSTPYSLSPIELVYLIEILEERFNISFEQEFFIEKRNIKYIEIEDYINNAIMSKNS